VWENEPPSSGSEVSWDPGVHHHTWLQITFKVTNSKICYSYFNSIYLTFNKILKRKNIELKIENEKLSRQEVKKKKLFRFLVKFGRENMEYQTKIRQRSGGSWSEASPRQIVCKTLS
jgi:protein subunit release factor B